MRKVLEIDVKSVPNYVANIVSFADRFTYSSVLLSNGYEDKYGQYELLAGIGAHSKLIAQTNAFAKLREFIARKATWLFGHLAYNLKNEVENLTTRKEDQFDFGQLVFFEPKILIQQPKGSSKLSVLLNEGVEESIIDDLLKSSHQISNKLRVPAFLPKISRAEYLDALLKIKTEIQQGNVYEINYCQEFYANEVQLDPTIGFMRLNEKSPMPFSAFYKQNSEYLLCASPERYLQKNGQKIISQPIKGTAKRGETKEQDEQLKLALKHDIKEQTENVMIVDLVRNDLSRTAQKGTVKLTELFGVYEFPQVYQLISTIESHLSAKNDLVDAIKGSFPMGSMTGAPKIAAMRIADSLEHSSRELYAGSVGYISPEQNADFNVVIRSLLYSKKTNSLSLFVGGAITAMSDVEKEYEECLLKAKAIFEL